MLHPTCMHTGVLLLTGRGTPLQQKPGICRLFHWLLHLSTTPPVFLRICTGGETYIQLYHQRFKMNEILNELTLNLNGCSLFFYELSLQKLSVLTVVTLTKLHFSCHCEIVKTFRLWRGLYSLSIAFCTWCWWAHSPIYIYIYIFLSSHRFLHTSPGSSLCDEYLICTFWNEDYSVLLAAADVSIQWHFVSSLTMAMFQQWCCLCGSYRSTLYVLKLYVAQRNQAVVFVVLLRQLHSLSGFTPLSVVKTHWPRKIDEQLHRLRGLGWQRRKEKWSRGKEEANSRKGSREGEKEAWDRFLAIRKFLKIESDKSPNGGAALKKKLTKFWGLYLHREELHRLVECDSYQQLDKIRGHQHIRQITIKLNSSGTQGVLLRKDSHFKMSEEETRNNQPKEMALAESDS